MKSVRAGPRFWRGGAGIIAARPAITLDDLRRHAVADSVRLLAPFDPVVWNRQRFEAFWGWACRFARSWNAWRPSSAPDAEGAGDIGRVGRRSM
jgi:hypothetical protein